MVFARIYMIDEFLHYSWIFLTMLAIMKSVSLDKIHFHYTSVKQPEVKVDLGVRDAIINLSFHTYFINANKFSRRW